MDEDYPIRMYRRKVDKIHRANQLTDNTVYLRSTKDPISHAPSCERASYPGSFANNGLYIRGESKQPAYPDYDRMMAQDRQYDQPYIPYISENEFRDQYGRIVRERVRSSSTARFANASMLPRKPGVMTATGYRKPTKIDKEIALAKEARAERFFDH